MEHTGRQMKIMEFLGRRRFASVAELAEVLVVSQSTARREIGRLEELGEVKSVYGGVVLLEYSNEVVPVSLRDGENAGKKEKIALEAAKLVKDNDTVILDASSTVRRLCRHLKERRNLTVITNNLRVCQELKDSAVQVYCTGGSLASRRECFLGHFAEEFIRNVKADLLFFSSQGLSKNGDITDCSQEEISLRRVMMDSAERKFFLCDSSKIGKNFPFTMCNLRDVTGIISDAPVPFNQRKNGTCGHVPF